MYNSGYSFKIINSIESTNNYAMALVHAGMAKHGDAFFCPDQKKGKGQRGKHWHSGNGENIAISIIIDPSALKIEEQFQLSATAAVATHLFFSKYTGEQTLIKWPNDIYWCDRKAAGILIENVIGQGKMFESETTWKYAVVGIGININQTVFDTSLINPVSLKQICGKEFNIVELAKELHQLLMREVDLLVDGGFLKILNRYNEHLYKKNSPVVLKKNKIIFETTIKSVSEQGQLLTSDLIDNHFDFGEVEWLLA
jgi:BirA family biotin operon repressor/biotin-[acetyl-CoA-carboxylase] ligase